MKILSVESLLIVLTWLTTALNIVLTKQVSELMGEFSFPLIFLQGVPYSLLLVVSLARKWRDPSSVKFGVLRWYEFLGIGGLITMYVFLLRVGTRGDLVSGDQVLLLTSAGPPPLIMLFSFLMIGRRFKLLHFVGMLLVIGGLLMFVLPGIVNATPKPGATGAIVALLCSALPLVFQGIALEHLFQTREGGDIIWITGVLASLLVPLSLLLIPLIPVTEPNVPWSLLGKHLRDGFACFFGQESSVLNLQCNVVGYWFLGYAAVNISWNLSGYYLTRKVSAAANYTAQSAAIPISALLFMIPVFDRGGDNSLTWLKGGAIAVVVAGLIVYRIQDETRGELWWLCGGVSKKYQPIIVINEELAIEPS